MNNIEANIKKMYIFQALRWFLIFMPVQVLFFQENGLKMSEVMILQTVFSLSLVIFEIPSGYYSDKIGRKKTLVIGSILSFSGYLIFSLAYDFITFLIAELILGIAGSFISGTDSAIIYDSLAILNKESEYKRTEGKLLSISNFSEATASIIGGFVASMINLRANIYIASFILFLAIPIALSVVEPERNKTGNTHSSMTNILKIVRYAIHQNTTVRYLSIFYAVISSSTLTLVWFVQPYWQLSGVPLIYYGILWAILNFSVGIFSLMAYRLEEVFGLKNSLAIIAFLPASGYFLLGLFPGIAGIIFMFIFYFVRGFSHPVLRDYINRNIDSDIRATVLSVASLLARLIFSVSGPFIGYISDKLSLEMAMISAGVLFLALGSISFILLYREKSLYT